MTIVVGIVVNPKLRRPVIVRAKEGEIRIHRLGYDPEHVVDVELPSNPWLLIGDGYYQADAQATEMSGLIRVHTPSGVRPKGAGYGTSLYTALCLGARAPEFAEHLPSAAKADLLRHSWPGVSSQPGGRSEEANAWWDAAISRGIAGRECIDTGDDEDDCTEVDLYRFRSVRRNHLLVAAFAFVMGREGMRPEREDWETLWTKVREHPEAVNDVHQKALLALDVRGLTLGAINMLGVLGVHAGTSDRNLDGLRMRWEHNLDPSAEIAQMVLPFKPNSSEARRAEDALALADEARAEVGWDRLEDLP